MGHTIKFIPALLLSLLCSSYVLAQAEAKKAKKFSRMLEEVVVTAQKREEDKLDTPISIQAFSAGALEAQGILDPLQLPEITPGLTVTEQVGYTTTYIRGVGSDAFLLADPSVTTYYDGIYQPFPNGLSQDFGAIERIEVLKGPQGTLFGRNAVGGAISIITRPPNLVELEAGLQVVHQRHDRTNTRAYVSVPVVEDHLAIGFSAVYNEGDNHIDGMAAGRPLPRLRDTGGRLRVRWSPAEWVDMTLTSVRIENHGPTTSYTPNRDPYLLLGGTIPEQDPRNGEVNEDLRFLNDNELDYGHISFFTDWFDVKLLGSKQKAFSSFNYDFDSSPMPLALFTIERVFADVETAEIQIISNDQTPFSSKLNWIVGAYYFESRSGFDPTFLRVGSTSLSEGVLLGVPIPPELTDLLSGLALPLPTGDIDVRGALDTESLAFYAQSTLEMTDWLSLTLGVRQQKEDRALPYSTSGLRNQDGSITPIMEFRNSDGDRTEEGQPLNDTTNSVDPKVVLEFRPNWTWPGDATLIYLSWQTAVKSSTFNTFNIYDAPDRVDAEEITAYELGIKTNPFGGAMSFEAAVFDYEIEDQQVQFISLLAGGAVQFENAGNVTIEGAEFSLATSLLPSIFGDLALTLGATYLDAVYSKYPNGSGFSEFGLLTQSNDFSGNQVVRTPEWSGNIGLLHTSSLLSGVLELGMNYYHNTGFFFSAQNIDEGYQDEYGLLNVHASYLYEPWGARVTVFGKNITDEEYSYGNFIADFGIGDAKAPLAVYGIRFNYDY